MKRLGPIFGSVVAAALLPAGAVSAIEDRAQPSEFQGQVAFGPCVGRVSHEWAGRVGIARSAEQGRYCQARVITPFSDPRLDGEVFVWEHTDRHMHGPTITYAGFSIVAPEGSWQQVPGITIDFSDRSDSTGTFAFEGSGSYEGLLAIAEIGLEQDVWTWRGWILDAQLPPPPQPPAAIVP